ncbi:MAG: 30S ribosomal protein S11 [Candidatus Bathyarchaeota archaeon]|nr:30S ribosomal protein S11 [Candidatus Bathyarchaeota archaeon]
MGKKRVIKPTKETLLKEREKIEERIEKGKAKGIEKKFNSGKVFIQSTYNNTMITVSDDEGNVIFWTSAGRVGFKGTKKGTPFAATKTAEFAASMIDKIGLKEIGVLIKGIGQGRESALRTLTNKGINIVSIKDLTPVPHNGCRPPKPRRV